MPVLGHIVARPLADPNFEHERKNGIRIAVPVVYAVTEAAGVPEEIAEDIQISDANDHMDSEYAKAGLETEFHR